MAMNAQRKVVLGGCVIGASLIFAYSLISPKAHGAQGGCGVGSLQGHYVFTGHGANVHYGAFDFDGGGKVTGKQTSLRDGRVQREDLQGTYSISADCNGKMTLSGAPGGLAQWDVFVTEDGKKGNMIRTNSSTAGVRTFER